MVEYPQLLARLDEVPGGRVSEEEIHALSFTARGDKRQVDQLVEAFSLSTVRLHLLYRVIEQRCRREPSPSAAILQALRALGPLIADRAAATPDPEPAQPEALDLAASKLTTAPAPAVTEAAPEPEPKFLSTAAIRAWLTAWLALPAPFMERLSESRLWRMFSRVHCPAPRDTDPREIGHLAVMSHLMERRRESNLARDLEAAELNGLSAMMTAGESGLHHLRVAVTRPEVRALLAPEDLPNFSVFLTLFSDLDVATHSDDPEMVAVRRQIAANLGQLARIDQEVREAAASLVAVARDLGLPRELALRFWGTQTNLSSSRMPVDDLPLTPEEAGRVSTLANMLLESPDAAAHEALLENLLAQHRSDASFIDATMLLLARGAHPESRQQLRAALGLPEGACDGATIDTLLKQRDATAATAGLRDLPDHHPAKVLLFCRTAWLLWKTGSTRDAEALAKRAMRIAPREPLPLQSLARLRMEMGQLDQAEKLLNAALRAGPDDPVTARMMAELHKRKEAARPA